jgi:hypothetical protein
MAVKIENQLKNENKRVLCENINLNWAKIKSRTEIGR